MKTDGKNLWKVEKKNANNSPNNRDVDIVEGNWNEVCNEYNPLRDDRIRISPLMNYKEDFGKMREYYSCYSPRKINVEMSKEIAVKNVMESIEKENRDMINRINEKINELSKQGESEYNFYDVSLDNFDRLKYYYTNKGFKFLYLDNHLRIVW